MLVLKSQDLQYIDNDKNVNSLVLFQLVGEIGSPIYRLDEDFINDYKRLLNPSFEDFSHSYIYSAGIRFNVHIYFKVRLNSSYLETKITDGYFIPYQENSSSGRLFEQRISITDFINSVNLELLPYQGSQFRSFFSLGLGLTFSKLFWNEDIQTSSVDDFRQGNEWINKIMIDPLFRMGFGTELNFDKYGRKSILGGVIISLNLNKIFRSENFFGVAEDQLSREGFEDLNKNYLLNNFILDLNIGLTLNFYNKEK